MSICDPFRFQSSYYKQCYEGTRLILNKAAAGFSSSFPQPRAALWDPPGAKPCRGARTPPGAQTLGPGSRGHPPGGCRREGQGTGLPPAPQLFPAHSPQHTSGSITKTSQIAIRLEKEKKKKNHQLGFVFPMISFNWILALCLLYFILGFIGFNYKSIVICYVALV